VNNFSQQNVTNRAYVTPKTLRYIRLYITDPGTDNYARIPEFEVRGQAAASVPAITLSPTSLSPQTNQGSSPSANTFTVQNTGQGTLSYTITDNVTWLSCTPTSGTSTSEADTITVSYSTASLSAGTYTATITVTDANASNSPQTIAVTLTVNVAGNMTDAVPSGTTPVADRHPGGGGHPVRSGLGRDKAIDGVLDGSSKWASDGSSPRTGSSSTSGPTTRSTATSPPRRALASRPGTTRKPSSCSRPPPTTAPGRMKTVVDNSAQANVTNRTYITPKTLRYIRLYITDPGSDNLAASPSSSPGVCDRHGRWHALGQQRGHGVHAGEHRFQLQFQLHRAKAIDGVVSQASKVVQRQRCPAALYRPGLSSSKTVTGFIARMAGAAGEYTTYNFDAFKFQSGTSISGPWTDECTLTNSSQASVISRRYTTAKSLRYVRLYITDAGTDNYARLPEFEVYFDQQRAADRGRGLHLHAELVEHF